MHNSDILKGTTMRKIPLQKVLLIGSAVVAGGILIGATLWSQRTESAGYIDPTKDFEKALAVNRQWLDSLQVVSSANSEARASAQRGLHGDDTTKTGMVGRDIFAEYLLEKTTSGTPGPLTESEAEKILARINERLNMSTDSVYTIADLHITGNNTPEGYLEYLANLDAVQENIDAHLIMDEFAVFLEAIEYEQDERFAPLDRNIEVYKNFEQALLQVSVPSDLSEVHLRYVTVIASLRMDTQAFRNHLVDPVASLLAIERYRKHLDDFANIPAKIQAVFERKE